MWPIWSPKSGNDFSIFSKVFGSSSAVAPQNGLPLCTKIGTAPKRPPLWNPKMACHYVPNMARHQNGLSCGTKSGLPLCTKNGTAPEEHEKDVPERLLKSGQCSLAANTGIALTVSSGEMTASKSAMTPARPKRARRRSRLPGQTGPAAEQLEELERGEKGSNFRIPASWTDAKAKSIATATFDS